MFSRKRICYDTNSSLGEGGLTSRQYGVSTVVEKLYGITYIFKGEAVPSTVHISLPYARRPINTVDLQ